MSTITLARNAMATRFELVLHGDNPVALRAAGEEALQEIDRLEAQLSLFRPTSEIAHINARAGHEAVRVTPETFALLRRARELSEATDGAFDITIGPLMRCWGFRDERSSIPAPAELAEARAKVGMSLVHLDESASSVRFARPGVVLDLGAIGKGYAIERAVELLRENAVASALVHGGTSTVYGLGHPPDGDAWRVAIVNPCQPDGSEHAKPTPALEHKQFPFTPTPTQEQMVGRSVLSAPPSSQQSLLDVRGALRTARPTIDPVSLPEGEGKRHGGSPFAIVSLQDEALSVSAVWGRTVEVEGKRYGHVIDPRTGVPANSAVLAAVVLPSATETDALSTALLTLGPEGHERITSLRPGIRTLVVAEADQGLQVRGRGIACT